MKINCGDSCYINNDTSILYLVLCVDNANYYQTDITQVVLRNLKTNETIVTDITNVTEVIYN